MLKDQIRIIDLTVTEFREILKESIQVLQPDESNKPTELLTLAEAAAFLRVSKVTIHKWLKEGKISTIRMGTRLRFKKDQLLSDFNKSRKK
jgi:excisionase family DNA binding protein